MNEDDLLMNSYLAEQGHSEQEIKQILKRLQEYDKRAVRDSVFDSIAGGSFEIANLLENNAADSDTEMIHDTVN